LGALPLSADCRKVAIMRNTILGAVAGLLVGTVGALGYSHYFGDGSLLADLQAQLDAAKAALNMADAKRKELAEETNSLSTQVNQLQSTNDQMKKQAATAPAAPAQPAGPAADFSAIAGALRDMFRGGGMRNPQQRMFLLQTRLKLSPEQAAKISAAMQADMRARGDMFQQMRNGGKVDPATVAAANTVDATMQAVLNPEQQRQYAQLQTDEKNARADSAANSQVNSIAPLLQLSDTQKDQVYGALYQTQLSAPDPTTLFGNPAAMATLQAQAAATAAAMQKALTPDQLAVYQQEQAMNGGPRRGGNTGGGNNGGANANANGNPPGGANVAAATPTPAAVNPAPAPAPAAAAPSTDGSSPASTNAPSATSSTSTDSTTNAPSTNSAPVTNAAPVSP
jgi:cell division protein FtsB